MDRVVSEGLIPMAAKTEASARGTFLCLYQCVKCDYLWVCKFVSPNLHAAVATLEAELRQRAELNYTKQVWASAGAMLCYHYW